MKLVISLDADNCVFNPGYHKSKSPNRLIEANEALIQDIIDKVLANPEITEVIFMVGSARQDKYLDDKGCLQNRTESFFTALPKICEEVNRRLQDLLIASGRKVSCRVDKALLADVSGNHPYNTNYNKSLKPLTKFQFSHWQYDKTKITILSFQTHHIESQKTPNDPSPLIDFHFYDDSYSASTGYPHDILDGLALIYSANPQFHPSTVKLTLNYYEGGAVQPIKVINGTGNCYPSRRHAALSMMDVDNNHVRYAYGSPVPENDLQRIRAFRFGRTTLNPHEFPDIGRFYLTCSSLLQFSESSSRRMRQGIASLINYALSIASTHQAINIFAICMSVEEVSNILLFNGIDPTKVNIISSAEVFKAAGNSFHVEQCIDDIERRYCPAVYTFLSGEHLYYNRMIKTNTIASTKGISSFAAKSASDFLDYKHMLEVARIEEIARRKRLDLPVKPAHSPRLFGGDQAAPSQGTAFAAATATTSTSATLPTP